MADKKKIATLMLNTTELLNESLVEAFDAGLKVHLSTDNSWPTEESSKNARPLVFMELKVEDGEVLAENVNPKYVKTPWRVCEHAFGQVIAWSGDIMAADVYEECSKCGTRRLYVYPKGGA